MGNQVSYLLSPPEHQKSLDDFQVPEGGLSSYDTTLEKIISSTIIYVVNINSNQNPIPSEISKSLNQIKKHPFI